MNYQQLMKLYTMAKPAMSVSGFIGGPLGYMLGGSDGRPVNSSSDMTALQTALRQARQAGAKGDRLVPSSAMPSWLNPSLSYAPQAPEHNNNEPSPLDAMANPAPAAPQPPAPLAASAPPMPQPRPAEAPQPDPQQGWFQRNQMMATEPGTSNFLDPSMAAQAVRGPDLIKKMTAYLWNKDVG